MTQSGDSDEYEDPLDELVVDEEAVNKELLAETLQNKVQIGKQSGHIHRREGLDKLTSKQQLAVLLLAQQARCEIDAVDVDSAWLSPSELRDISGLAKGTVNPKVRELAEEGIAKSNDGEYCIPGHKFTRAKQIIQGDE